jgi:hypothetical protein
MITYRPATAKDAPAIGAFQKANGYNWNIWREEVIARYLPLKHVHVLLAYDGEKLVGFVHWVEGEDEKGPVGYYVGAIVDVTTASQARLDILDTLSLAFGDALGKHGRWVHEASPGDTEGITYARMVAPQSETVVAGRYLFEGDIAATYAHIQSRKAL